MEALIAFGKKVAALVDVKSLVTLCFTVVFAVLSLTGVVAASDFLTVFLIIITYYFNKDKVNTPPADS